MNAGSTCGLCHGTGYIEGDPDVCTCDPGPEGQHHWYCGTGPCPNGCPVPAYPGSNR